MLADPRGLTVTAASAEAVARLDATILAYCGLKRDTGERLKAALGSDPKLVLGHLLRGYFMLHMGKRELLPRVAEAAAAADRAMRDAGATPCERLHRQALQAWLERDEMRAIAFLEQILAAHPVDLVALKLAQFLLFYAGDGPRMRAVVAGALGAWDDSLPGYGFVLGCHAFGLEETGDYEQAEATGRRAIAFNPEDSGGAHAVAHVFEMTDRVEYGLAWIGGLESHWRDVNNFAFHVWWHRCLFLLAQRRYDEVLERYDREVRADSTEDYLDITNAVAMLWRLEQQGVGVGHRWDELAARAAERREDHALVFADVHYAMALAAKGEADFAAWESAARSYAANAEKRQARIMSSIGLALGEAAAAHRRGDYAQALALLLPLRDEIRQIGGSHAQRDLFAQLLIDSAVKAKRRDVARDLLRERLAARPRNPWGLGEMELLDR